jgi:hypothetical protein
MFQGPLKRLTSAIGRSSLSKALKWYHLDYCVPSSLLLPPQPTRAGEVKDSRANILSTSCSFLYPSQSHTPRLVLSLPFYSIDTKFFNTKPTFAYIVKAFETGRLCEDISSSYYALHHFWCVFVCLVMIYVILFAEMNGEKPSRVLDCEMNTPDGFVLGRCNLIFTLDAWMGTKRGAQRVSQLNQHAHSSSVVHGEKLCVRHSCREELLHADMFFQFYDCRRQTLWAMWSSCVNFNKVAEKGFVH